MKNLGAFLLVASVTANIVFNHVQLKCDLTDNTRLYHGCLEGQYCTEQGECVAAKDQRLSLSFRKDNPTVSVRDIAVARPDGRCGKDFGNSACDPQGPFGGCCSSYGYCGNTDGHCLASKGCQNGCANSASTPDATPSLESASKEPIILAPVTLLQAGGLATQDGTCGAANNNTVCDGWVDGNCCSMYGFCGSTTGHCGAGCQSGGCTATQVNIAPSASPAPAAINGGSFQTIGQAGVGAMHAGLLPNGKVFFLDKLENYSQIKMGDGNYAMSSEYDPVTNRPVALEYSTNAFCSGGSFLADGRVVSVGGNAPLSWINPKITNGFNAIRTLQRSSSDASLDGRAWQEPPNRKLASARWYATAQTMPDGSVFVASGSLNGLDPTKPENNNPTYEMLNRDGMPRGQNIPMEILAKNQPYYMYPFVHLLSDGNLFVFVSKQSQIFNVGTNTIVKQLPDLAGQYRTYPNTGGSVLLPLSSANQWNPEVIICGGGAYQDVTSPTDASCGKIAPLDANAAWEMDAMPEGRGMVEATLLPDGTVIWVNGGSKGAQGFGLMGSPTLTALLYDPSKPAGQRFSSLASSGIPRLYHSCSLLMLDGTLMVVGSNPVEMPKLQPDAKDPYVTDYRVEQYVPPYLQGDNANKRPTNMALSTKDVKADGSQFNVEFDVPANAKDVKVTLYHGGFVTHSIHMGHRMLYLDHEGWQAGASHQKLTVSGPPNNNVAPPGPYVVYIVVDGIPTIGQFVQVA